MNEYSILKLKDISTKFIPKSLLAKIKNSLSKITKGKVKIKGFNKTYGVQGGKRDYLFRDPPNNLLDEISKIIQDNLKNIFIQHIEDRRGYGRLWKPTSSNLKQFRQLVHVWEDNNPDVFSEKNIYRGPSTLQNLKRSRQVRDDDAPFDIESAILEIKNFTNVIFEDYEVSTSWIKEVRSKRELTSKKMLDFVFDFKWFVEKAYYDSELVATRGLAVFVQDVAHSGFKERYSKNLYEDYKDIILQGYTGGPKHEGVGNYKPYFVYPTWSFPRDISMNGIFIGFTSYVTAGEKKMTARPYLYLTKPELELVYNSIGVFLLSKLKPEYATKSKLK